MLEWFKYKYLSKEERKIRDQIVCEVEEMLKGKDVSCRVVSEALQELKYRQQTLEGAFAEKTIREMKYKDIFPE